jgi:GxxExxY protein
MRELQLQGLEARNQVALAVAYKGEMVGEYIADIIVADRVVLELKAQTAPLIFAEAQLLNYLKAGELRVGMLINFTYPRATIKRLVA